MAEPTLANPAEQPRSFRVACETLRVVSRGRVDWIDLTDAVERAVERSGVDRGIVSVQTLHTTTAIVINEAEPLLQEDMRGLCDRWAPKDIEYLHDRKDLRTVNVVPGEKPNGDAHARAMLFGSSETVAVQEGRPLWGRWQRLFLVELDGRRSRDVVISILGSGPAPDDDGDGVGNGETQHASHGTDRAGFEVVS